LSQATWTRASNRWLLKAGASFGHFVMSTPAESDVAPTDVSIVDIGTGVVYGSPATSPFTTTSWAFISKDAKSFPLNLIFNASYVTGSHAIKFGITDLEGWHIQNADVNQGMQWIFFNKFPVALTEFATPFNESLRIRSTGLFAQDQWTLKRMTVNYGLRIDYFNGW